MTQPSTTDSDQLSASPRAQGEKTKSSVSMLAQDRPAVRHPNFDPDRTPIDPARPLTDIPDPVPNHSAQLERLFAQSSVKQHNDQRSHLSQERSSSFVSTTTKHTDEIRFAQERLAHASKWALIASEALADHLALLSAARLIELPDSFYHNHSTQPLLMPMTTLPLLDMSDIHAALRDYPQLTRYGLQQKPSPRCSEPASREAQPKLPATTSASVTTELADELYGEHSVSQQLGFDHDELLNSNYADDWEVILYPERFDSASSTNMGSLATDVIACSAAVFILQQCPTRKSINSRYSARDICQYMRSYLLSQLSQLSQLRRSQTNEQLFRQIRLFAGHVIVAAHYLGWDIQISEDGEVFFNISSRCGLLSRYPNITEYHINGWSSQIG